MTGPVTVAVVAPRYPPDVGGLENYARWTVGVLREAGHRVVVITTRPGLRTRRDSIDGVPVIRLGTWLVLSNTPVSGLWPWQVWRWLRREQVDVVATHAPVPGLADVATFVSGRRPVIATYHAGSMVKGTGGVVDALLRGYERWVLPRVLGRAARTVAVSPVALTASRPGHVDIPPGVDTSVFVPGDRVREQRIVFAGRIERTSRWKGLQVLIDAMPAVLGAVPDAQLVVVGDGDDVPALRARAESLGVGGSLQWLGRLDAAGLSEQWQRASVACLPSLTEAESFGMTLIEAMACGCPVVGSAVAGPAYVIRDGVDGRLVPPGDSVALASALLETLQDSQLREARGRAGREAAETRWAAHLREAALLDLIASATGG